MRVKALHFFALLLAGANEVESKERMQPPGAGGGGERHHDENRLAQDVRSVPVDQRTNPSCPPTSMHSEFPCEDDVESSEMTNQPTNAPISGRLDFPTVAPTVASTAVDTPTLSPTIDGNEPSFTRTDYPTTTESSTFNPSYLPINSPTADPALTASKSPSANPSLWTLSVSTQPVAATTSSSAPSSPQMPTPSPATASCVSTDGTFGIVDRDDLIVVPVNYVYELETVPDTTESEIENEILPNVERAIVDSLLSEAFPDGCNSSSFGRKRIRVRRRLEVTGISMNPPDLVNPEFVCETEAMFDPANDCVIVDGELMLFTDNGHAEEEQALIQEFIKNEMDSGAYDNSSDRIVRMRYLDVSLEPPESNLPGENNENGSSDVPNIQNDVRIGVLVGLFAVLALVSGITYGARRRQIRNADDGNDLRTNNDIISGRRHSVSSQSESFNFQTESFNVHSESFN
jgi:hypothetical protein